MVRERPWRQPRADQFANIIGMGMLMQPQDPYFQVPIECMQLSIIVQDNEDAVVHIPIMYFAPDVHAIMYKGHHAMCQYAICMAMDDLP